MADNIRVMHLFLRILPQTFWFMQDICSILLLFMQHIIERSKGTDKKWLRLKKLRKWQG